ncbi:MAG TPA: hypothetical protein P5526_25635 [Anaerolineae bacterium]|nr:hypothetical protein [Anaerolineae bacterium]MCB0225946.1 hypothetical protein [Anaerolineae bacterium]MCB9108795.1 hypothetical protein [Anaerolineales bacterium]HRV95562.1 hypothetical protein [Anaerolineae bacterium]
MKNDKFLIGIVIGIVVLVIVSLTVVLLRRPGEESYIADDTPAGVVHNYYLALQRKDYEKAYSYLSDDLKSKPDLDKFIRDLDNYGRQSDASLQIGETTQTDGHAQVDVAITTYRAGGIFDSNTYTDRNTAYLQATPDGSGWWLTQFPYPYWGYDWDNEE